MSGHGDVNGKASNARHVVTAGGSIINSDRRRPSRSSTSSTRSGDAEAYVRAACTLEHRALLAWTQTGPEHRAEQPQDVNAQHAPSKHPRARKAIDAPTGYVDTDAPRALSATFSTAPGTRWLAARRGRGTRAAHWANPQLIALAQRPP
ncbi:hypothetical protein TRAPUB_2536 [Trametes pubescens]|uniref:Uncharacterized protein n=1 Tax=Trametes pubescens TaxID=154538 RepID=A0A1M2VGB9_TRAPU|nr:hypothetical protein TRAPUB_2536 [Trametes pubescens]